jgi:hypothetical protein
VRREGAQQHAHWLEVAHAGALETAQALAALDRRVDDGERRAADTLSRLAWVTASYWVAVVAFHQRLPVVLTPIAAQ